MSPGGWFATKQRGGSWFDGLSQGMFGIKQTRGTRQNYAVKQKKPVRKQKGGSWFDVERKKPVRKQNGGTWFERFAGKKQKGGSWFDDLSQGMFGVKRSRRKRKRKPAVIHSEVRSQKGGANPFKGFFENPFHVREKLGRGKKQKGGVLGLRSIEKWYGNNHSKKQQREMDAWFELNDLNV
jgi:hypothetical protein